ncbi:MAG: hypothetical protein MJ200_04815 [Mycoplasmoidaceae bacterium]|nr:hypothetical protein [Mycoplasmoidaceae bacterium]
MNVSSPSVISFCVISLLNVRVNVAGLVASSTMLIALPQEEVKAQSLLNTKL